MTGPRRNGMPKPGRDTGDTSRAHQRPRDAATLVIVDRTASSPRILMGRRRPDQVFLPNTFVFPGGRVEAADRAFARHHALAPSETERLKIAMRGRPTDTRAAALALAAIRETFEETGIVVGEAAGAAPQDPVGGWSDFLAAGFRPRLDRLAFFARAITPPGRARRYDTRFFIVDASEVAHRAERVDGELLDIDWYTIERAKTLDLPSITRHVMEDIATLVNMHGKHRQKNGVPFYVERYGRLERKII